MAVGALSLATPVLAQSQSGATSETGSLITRRPASVNGRTRVDARQTTRQFGACVVGRRRALAQNAVLAPIEEPVLSKLIRSLVTDDCLGPGELQMPFVLMRAAIIEALYLAEFGRLGPTSFEGQPAIDYWNGAKQPAEWSSNIVALARFGDCVARADGQAARALVLSLPGSGGEGAVFTALYPRLGACLSKDQKFAFSRSMLRGAIGEGLYRLSHARQAAQ